MAAGVAVSRPAVDTESVSDNLPHARLAVLGATGTVGAAALAVAERAGLEVFGLAARASVPEMAKLCERHRPTVAAMHEAEAADKLRDMLAGAGVSTQVKGGADAVSELARGEADTVVAAISGVAGVASTQAAAQAGKRVLLANKEALIVTGRSLIEACERSGGELVPVDSEHGALLELLHLARDRRDHVRKAWLTASGGPFLKRKDLADVTPEMARAHPVWNMGTKISIDSATLMNKGMELIEACLLFGFAPGQVEVVIHPQGIVHAIVEFADGGCVAQCGPPDMRVAVARALAWPQPHRLDFGRLDWRELGSLEFAPPDTNRFPCLRLAREALVAGGSAPTVLNAANEIAVEAFANGESLRFVDIANVVEATLAEMPGSVAADMQQMLEVDMKARQAAKKQVRKLAC